MGDFMRSPGAPAHVPPHMMQLDDEAICQRTRLLAVELQAPSVSPAPAAAAGSSASSSSSSAASPPFSLPSSDYILELVKSLFPADGSPMLCSKLGAQFTERTGAKFVVHSGGIGLGSWLAKHSDIFIEDKERGFGKETVALRHPPPPGTQAAQLGAAAASAFSGSPFKPRASPARSALSADVSAWQQRVNAALPTDEWTGLVARSGLEVGSLKLQHGHLPPLEVRALHHHAVCSAAEVSELNDALLWLLESVHAGGAEYLYALIGVCTQTDWEQHARAAEGPRTGGGVRLLQLATPTRCLLLRIPSQADLMRSGTGQALFTPYFRERMADPQLLKVGADTCTPALALWNSSVSLDLNGCVNLGWLASPPEDAPWSLHQVADSTLGPNMAFLARDDGVDWGAPQLSLAQLVHAAVQAQVSALCGRMKDEMPRSVNVRDLPGAWLTKYAEWSSFIRAAQAQPKHLNDAGMLESIEEVASSLRRYFLLYLQRTEPFHPFVHVLLHNSFLHFIQAQRAIPVLSIEHSLRGASPSLLATQDFSFDTSNLTWWFHSGKGADGVQPNMDQSFLRNPAWKRLDYHQRGAIKLADQKRIHVIEGMAGSGKTLTLATAAVLALARSPSIKADISHASQRVLCVCSNDVTARHMASVLATMLPASQLLLAVPSAFLQQWQRHEYLPLLAGGYVLGQSAGLPQHPDECDVLVCSVSSALSPLLLPRLALHHRQTVIIDTAHAIWAAQAVRLLRHLPHTERLIISGDSGQTCATFGGQPVDSLLDVALKDAEATDSKRGSAAASSASAASTAAEHSVPTPFRRTKSPLNQQHRVPDHMRAVLNPLCYASALDVPTAASPARAVDWHQVDLPGGLREGDVCTFQAEMNQLHEQWDMYKLAGSLNGMWSEADMAILVLSEAHRYEILRRQPSWASRVRVVEELEGQEVSVALLCLGCAQLAPSKVSRARLALACSRATVKLVVLGDRRALCETAGRSDLGVPSAMTELCFLAERPLASLFKHVRTDQEEAQYQASEKLMRQMANEEGADTAAATAAPAAAAASSSFGPSTAAAPAAVSASHSASSGASFSHKFEIFPRTKVIKSKLCKFHHSHSSMDVEQGVRHGACKHGERCDYVHDEFWVSMDPSTLWLVTPGSARVLIAKEGDLFADHLQDIHTLMDSTHNHRQVARHGGEVAADLEKARRNSGIMTGAKAAAAPPKPSASPAAPGAPAWGALVQSSQAAASGAAPTAPASAPLSHDPSPLMSPEAVAAAAAAASFLSRPRHTFEPVPRRNWKLNLCDKMHRTEDAPEKYRGYCSQGANCGFLHEEFWCHAPKESDCFWLVTPGHTVIYREGGFGGTYVDPQRKRDLNRIIATPENQRVRREHAKEVAYLFPSLAEAQGTVNSSRG